MYEEIIHYNDNEDVIYRKHQGEEQWWEYDDYENETLYKTSWGYEKRSFYNDAGYLIKVESTDGEEKYEYDENNNCISEWVSDRGFIHYKYNENNDCIYRYDEFNDLLKEWVYDEENRLIHFKNNVGDFEKFSYDERGNIILHQTSEFERWYEYDELNRKISTIIVGYRVDTFDYQEESYIRCSEYHNGLRTKTTYNLRNIVINYEEHYQ